MVIVVGICIFLVHHYNGVRGPPQILLGLDLLKSCLLFSA